MVNLMFQELFAIFLTFYILIDPLGVSMIYVSLTGHLDGPQKRKTAIKAPLIAFLVLSIFIFLGPAIIQALGIHPGSLYVAGGILLFLIAIDLLFGRFRRTKSTPQNESEETTDVSVFPLAMPLLSGPGAITAVLLFLSDPGRVWWHQVRLQIIIAGVLFTACCAMLASSIIARVLRKTGVMVIERIMGILLSGMSVQFVYLGLQRLGVPIG